MSITVAQIRAARGLLNWSQGDLSERTGISGTSIGAIENGVTVARRNTLNIIQATFENAGIEFVESGIRYKPDTIKIIEGANSFLRLLDDVYLTLKDAESKELLISFSDDRVSPPEVNENYRRMRKTGIAMRQIIREGNTYLMGGLDEYRYMPEDFFINRVTLIYGSKFAIVLSDEKKITVINDTTIANVQRNIFNFIWHNAKSSDISTATERFD